MEEVRPGKYQHYKGNFYVVIGEAKHTETGEEFVVYRPIKEFVKLFVRPKRMFLEDAVVDGRKVPRFNFISQYI